MKLRLGSTNIDLAHRFEICATTVTNIFITWLKVMVQELSCLIYNPLKESILQSMPKSCKKAGFTKVRNTIDCTKIFIETPNDPMLKAATWSDYRHHPIAKVLFAISLNRAFTFISKAWAGRTSDVHITQQSGLYDILEPYDEVMAVEPLLLLKTLFYIGHNFIFLHESEELSNLRKLKLRKLKRLQI